ncbi:MAG: hypothetical protein R3Y36_06430 [Spirochaetales bacterium]
MSNADLLRFVLTSTVALIAFYAFLDRNYENVFTCILTLILFSVPVLAKSKFKVDLPSTLEIIILLFIFAAQILGEIRSYYTLLPFWDTMLHTANGFLAAAVGFSLVDLLNKDDTYSIQLSPFFLVLTALCFSMTIGVLWEIFEFSMDYFFATDMQKDSVVTHINSVIFDPNNLNNVVKQPLHSVVINGEDWIEMYGGYIDIGLIDTMEDLLVNLVGAIVFSVIAYISLIGKAKGKFVKRFIPVAKN